jgi:DNA-binding MarR family transcriptional regulator
MPTWQPEIAPFVNRIPRLYLLLRAARDVLHADLGISTGMRGVMASLAAAGPKAVPDLARERPVSRQHIQTLVNALLAAGLVATSPNPQHRRSPLVGLTDKGRRRLKEMQDREAEMFARTAPAVSPVELAAAMRLFDLIERDLAARVIEQELG